MLDGAGDLAALKMPSGRGAFIERIQAMMDAPARGGPRVMSPQDAFVADLGQRFGEKALLIEERRGDDGDARLLVVLDVDDETQAAESARAAANVAVAVDILDLAAWKSVRRLAASGLLQFTQASRELCRSPALPSEPTVATAALDGRGARAMAEADRALRMAKTLTGGGFPEEAPALLVKSLHAMAAALMGARGEGASGASSAGDADIRRLVDRGSLPAEALVLLDALRSPSSAAAKNEVAPLLAATARILAPITRNEPSLTARTA